MKLVPVVSQLCKRQSLNTVNFLRKSQFSTTVKERQGFGSFHSEDIEVLIRAPEETYEPPAIYASIHTRLLDHIKSREQGPKRSTELPVFGRAAKEHHFVIDSEWNFINHGAFGGALRNQLLEASLWRNECEAQPLRFFDRHLLPMIAFTLRRVAAFLNCPPTELLPLPNVTAGLNSVINSIELKKNDEVMCMSLTYGSTKKILKETCDRTEAKLVNVHIPLNNITAEDIIERVTAQISSQTKLIIIDQITSNTAIAMPVLELAAKCKSVNPNIVVLVDAAHSLFAQDVSIYSRESAGLSPSISTTQQETRCLADVADIWITNGHKWLCTNKGCAFMWVSPRVAGKLRPAIISHGYAPGEEGRSEGRYAARNKMLSSFSWDGCR
jgi:hypothetical protein